jgi:hypothetical protein
MVYRVVFAKHCGIPDEVSGGSLPQDQRGHGEPNFNTEGRLNIRRLLSRESGGEQAIHEAQFVPKHHSLPFGCGTEAGSGQNTTC